MMPSSPFRRLKTLIVQERGMPGTGISPIEKSQMQTDILDAKTKANQLKTLVHDVRDYVTDITGASDVTAQLQNAVDSVPAGEVLYIPAHAVMNLTDTITISNPIVIDGPGEFRFTAGIATKTGLQIGAANTTISGVKITNPNNITSPSGTSSRAINIAANYAAVTGCHIDGWETGIVQNAAGEFWGLVIDGNKITNVNGVGSENKGDGIMVVGSGALITNNLVEAKVGTDARCGIVIEGLPTFIVSNQTDNGTNIDDTAFVVSGNIIRGPFRRSIHAEGVENYTIADNVCIGARWWGMMLWSAHNGTVANNHIVWTENGSTGAVASIPTPLYAQLSFGVHIVNNHIIIKPGTTWLHAMYLAGGGAPASARYSVDGNTFINESTTAGTAIRGEQVNNETIAIRNNVIRGPFGKAAYLYSSLSSGSRSADAFISGNDVKIGASSYAFHTYGYRRSFIEHNYMASGSSTYGVRVEAGDFALVAHNKIAGSSTGVNCLGTTGSYAPNNTFFGVATPTASVTSTTTYGP